MIDRAYRAEVKEDKLKHRLAKRGIVPITEVPQDSLQEKFNYWYNVVNDSFSTDSVRKIGKERIKLLTVQKARAYPWV